MAESGQADPTQGRAGWDGLLLLLAIVGAGSVIVALGQPWSFAPGFAWLWPGLLAATMLGGIALHRLATWLPEPVQPPPIPAWPRRWRRWLGWAVITGSVALLVYTIVDLWQAPAVWRDNVAPWVLALAGLWLGSLLIVRVDFVSFDDQKPKASQPAPGALPARLLPWQVSPWVEALLFALILVVAIFLRTYRLDQIPQGFFIDETNVALSAIHILEGENPSPFGTGWYETPNGYAYYMATLIHHFGATYTTLKAASILPTILTVVAVFLLARQLFGPISGLLAMGLLAANRWHMTIGRWGWNETMPPFFLALSAFFLVRGLQNRRASDYVLGGVIGGLMTYTYLSSRLAIASLLLYLGIWLFLQPGRLGPRLGHSWPGIGLFILAGAMTVAPIGVTYVQNPFTFFNRSAEITILNDVQAAGSWEPLRQNGWNYVQFLFQEGDPVGRQNLPGAPQVNGITALFFVLGLGYSFLRFREPRQALLLSMLLVNLTGGVLTQFDDTSPNAYRVMNILVPVTILAGYALSRSGQTLAAVMSLSTLSGPGQKIGSLGSEGVDKIHRGRPSWKIEASRKVWTGHPPEFQKSQEILGGVGRLTGMATALALVGLSGAQDAATYFGPQASHPQVWSSYNQMETQVAYTALAVLDQDQDLYLIPHFYDFSPLGYMIWGRVQVKTGHASLAQPPYRRILPARDLPLVDRGRDAVLLLDLHYEGLRTYLTHFYPQAKFETIFGIQDTPLFLKVTIERKDLVGLQGVQAIWQWENGGTEMAVMPSLSVEREKVARARRLTWQGTLAVERAGLYDLLYPWDMGVMVDGQPWVEPRYLLPGPYSLQAVWERGDSDRPFVQWRTPDGQIGPIPGRNLYRVMRPAQGLTATYYPNPDWQEPALLNQVTPFLLLTWPPEGLFTQPFSVRFTGSLLISGAGVYRLRLQADDGVRLLLDGERLGEALIPDQPNSLIVTADLAAGQHPIQIDYFQNRGGNGLEFYWQPLGQPEVPVPPQALLPVSAP